MRKMKFNGYAAQKPKMNPLHSCFPPGKRAQMYDNYLNFKLIELFF